MFSKYNINLLIFINFIEDFSLFLLKLTFYNYFVLICLKLLFQVFLFLNSLKLETLTFWIVKNNCILFFFDKFNSFFNSFKTAHKNAELKFLLRYVQWKII